MNLSSLQHELRQRSREPFISWGQRQNNHWDALTNFVYATPTWEGLKREAARLRPADVDSARFFAYAANRWFNFWSARGVEEIFCRLEGVQAAKNPRDRLVDFSIHGVTFDHKTSVFPKSFPGNFQGAAQHPQTLIRWLYQNQSGQRRQHFHNRLFIILYDSRQGEHWKLRAELGWLEAKIQAYVKRFAPDRLVTLQFENGQTALSDIIWAVK